jgi:hypothetical protein
LLITEHHASDHCDSAEDDGEHIQQLYKAAEEQTTESEIKKSRKEILFFGHAASWAHKFMMVAGVVDLSKAIPCWKSSEVRRPHRFIHYSSASRKERLKIPSQ